MKRRQTFLIVSLCTCLTGLATAAPSSTPYSTPLRHTYPTTVYWGDTHVHTTLSGDAYGLGNRITADDANRFARGEAITAHNGQPVRLRRPLDFIMVADHSQNFGVYPRLADGDPLLTANQETMPLSELLKTIPATTRDALNAEDDSLLSDIAQHSGKLKSLWSSQDYTSERFARQLWHDVIATAERYNDPGRFTSFIGYEWSPRVIHRNIIFRGDAEQTRQVLPFSSFDSINPEDLWAHLAEYEDRVGDKVISVPHNSNLGGDMFKTVTFNDSAMTTDYAQLRARFEPIIEVTQFKGDSETHPQISPEDAFADFETWPKRKLLLSAEQLANRYARPALMQGLNLDQQLGINPFKFGMIGSTDSHTSLATADEDNFWGKVAIDEPSPFRLSSWQYSAAGYAGVWATENTRASLFDAMKRKETYATTGPRITIRFFGGWSFTPDDAMRPDLASTGYSKGVPMGGDLYQAPVDTSPVFIIRATKDPDGANLDRVQVIKGWQNKNGELQEKIYEVALADHRKPLSSGMVKPVGNTVNLTDASYRNSIGDPELSVAWTDPDFNPQVRAFYYVRVLQIPTPRWTAYDAVFFGHQNIPEEIPLVTQDRAYTSPIWYTP